ncbi:MAG: citrate synthase [Ardenticatenales bacterium]|nr:citrate synthase [Ardenticatenales bacterium]
MADNTVTLTDNRTDRSYELPIEHDTITAMNLRQIKVNDDDFGMMAYDPGYKNTASVKSTITYIDGDKGILEYRGYPIEQLAEQSTFLEVAYLLLYGELPTADELTKWEERILHHTYIHESLTQLISTFRYDAHPMSILISSLAAMRSFHPESINYEDEAVLTKQIYRLLGKLPTVAAFAYRHRIGRPVNYPDATRGYTGNFLYMLDYMGEQGYEVNPVLAHALDVLFILHADHEQNASTSVMRAIGSTGVDPYSAMAGAAAALFGPAHGGANEAVVRMLNEIGSTEHIPQFIERVKSREVRLMGFGHRVYKNYDPRARIIKQIADQVFEVTGTNPLLDIALELEQIALNDEYFIERKLYPNVDFYSGIIYKSMGFPVDMFPVLFALPRAAGWLSQWMEHINDKEQAIARPRQIFLGERERDYVPIDER